MLNASELRSNLAAEIPTLWTAISAISEKWAARAVSNLDQLSAERVAFPKTFTDPVLGPIELFEWEVAILDSPLIQRLRGIRQLGMAHAVYTGATHDRLSHTLGVVEVADRMMNALSKNAVHHKEYGTDRDPYVPEVKDDDRYSIRMAALLHDIGHGPFSHASEPLMERAHRDEFEHLRNILRTEFPGAAGISTSEAVAVLLVMSGCLQRIFEHRNFRIRFQRKSELPIAIVARLLGSWREVQAGYLAGIISSPIDADKLDYMARDSYFTGLPLGLDVQRLINKLEVLTITQERAPNKELRDRAQKAPYQRIYHLGLSIAGLTAYEQMIIGRVLLYDRVYYHHKVRCAEAMSRRLFRVAELGHRNPFSITDLLTDMGDDTMVHHLSGELSRSVHVNNASAARVLGQRMRDRHFFHRAFAFAERFLAGIDQLPGKEQDQTRMRLWQDVMDALGEEEDREDFAREIHKLSKQLCEVIPELNAHDELMPEDIIVDMTIRDPIPDTSKDVFLRTESGDLAPANLFFNPDQWSEAYKNQKKCAFVFAPRSAVTVVALATQILLFERFGVIMKPQARHLCKLEAVSDRWVEWLNKAKSALLCSPGCVSALTDVKPQLVPVRPKDIRPPEQWIELDPGFSERVAKGFDPTVGGSFVASVTTAVVDGINHLCHVLQALEERGEFAKNERPDEKRRLQREISKALSARGCHAREGQEIGGGESDLILPGEIVIENKVADEAVDLDTLKPDAPWQARRYAFAFNRSVFFTVIAYKPANEGVNLPPPKRISVHRLEGSPEQSVYVRFLIPWGTDTPSKAKAPE